MFEFLRRWFDQSHHRRTRRREPTGPAGPITSVGPLVSNGSDADSPVPVGGTRQGAGQGAGIGEGKAGGKEEKSESGDGGLGPPADLEFVCDRVERYFGGQRTVVVFRYGTCVVVEEDCAEPEIYARKVLERMRDVSPDFSVRLMDDGNYTVWLSGPGCFCVISTEEILGEFDRSGGKLATSREVIVGMFGRSQMFDDLKEPRVVRVMPARAG
jgi:hypothetical protein